MSTIKWYKHAVLVSLSTVIIMAPSLGFTDEEGHEEKPAANVECPEGDDVAMMMGGMGMGMMGGMGMGTGGTNTTQGMMGGMGMGMMGGMGTGTGTGTGTTGTMGGMGMLNQEEDIVPDEAITHSPCGAANKSLNEQ